MIATYKIGRAGRILKGDEVPLCGSSNEETETQVLGLAQVFSLRQKKKKKIWLI